MTSIGVLTTLHLLENKSKYVDNNYQHYVIIIPNKTFSDLEKKDITYVIAKEKLHNNGISQFITIESNNPSYSINKEFLLERNKTFSIEEGKVEIQKIKKLIEERDLSKYKFKFHARLGILEPHLSDIEAKSFSFIKSSENIISNSYTMQDIRNVRKFKESYFHSINILNELISIFQLDESIMIQYGSMLKDYLRILTKYNFLDDFNKENLGRIHKVLYNKKENDTKHKSDDILLDDNLFSSIKDEIKESIEDISKFEQLYKRGKKEVQWLKSKKYFNQVINRTPRNMALNDKNQKIETESTYDLNKRVAASIQKQIEKEKENLSIIRNKLAYSIEEKELLVKEAIKNRIKLLEKNIFKNGQIYYDLEELYDELNDSEQAKKSIITLSVNYIFSPSDITKYKDKYPDIMSIFPERT